MEEIEMIELELNEINRLAHIAGRLEMNFRINGCYLTDKSAKENHRKVQEDCLELLLGLSDKLKGIVLDVYNEADNIGILEGVDYKIGETPMQLIIGKRKPEDFEV